MTGWMRATLWFVWLVAGPVLWFALLFGVPPEVLIAIGVK